MALYARVSTLHGQDVGLQLDELRQDHFNLAAHVPRQAQEAFKRMNAMRDELRARLTLLRAVALCREKQTRRDVLRNARRMRTILRSIGGKAG